MPHYFFWPVFGVTLFLALMAMAMVRSHLSASRKLQLRAIQKEERMKAIEAGVPLPEVDEPMRGVSPQIESPEAFTRQVQWLRVVSLVSGCFMVFAGIGMFIGFEFSSDRGFREMSTLGSIPTMGGLGLLLFYWLSREHH
jgi:hypothetical protein